MHFRKAVFAASCCSMLVGTPAVSQQIGAEIIHQWTSASESAGVKVLADALKARGAIWVDNAISGGPNARATAVNRVIGGKPPTAMMFNTGPQFVELVENDLLRDLTPQATAAKWSDRLPAALIETGRRNGKVWAVPVSGNGANWFWFNKKLLDQFGLAKPQSWDQVFAALDRAKAAGVIPFAMAGEPRWERLAFNAIVLGVAGRAVYEQVYVKLDAAGVRTPGFRKAVETFQRLKSYADPGNAGRSWSDSANLVMRGGALMTQAGTWANGAFLSAGQRPGTDYECALIEPDQGMILSGDVFLFPKVAAKDQQQAQELVMDVLTDPAVQTKFAAANGTIPIMNGADTSALDRCTAEAARYFTDARRSVAGDQMMFPPPVVGAIEDGIARFWAGTSLSVDAFIDLYAKALANK